MVRIRKNTLLFMSFLAVFSVSLYAQDIYAQGLYKENNYQSLVSDQRSIKPGDILTVLVYEAATASTSSNVDLSKSSNIGLSLSDGTNNIGGAVGIDNGFGGSGRKNRSEKLVASVAVTVLKKTHSGEIVISGEQLIEFNKEIQTILVSGSIRPEDVTPDNTVLSSRIANAIIKVEGEGLLTNHTKPGLITRFFSWLF